MKWYLSYEIDTLFSMNRLWPVITKMSVPLSDIFPKTETFSKGIFRYITRNIPSITNMNNNWAMRFVSQILRRTESNK
jgi:hypothetical protein